MKIKNLESLDNDFKELLSKGGVSFLFRILGQVAGFALSFVIANNFGADSLGDYVLAIIVLRIGTMLAKMGIDTTAVRMISSFASQYKWQSIKLFIRKVIILLSLSSVFYSGVLYFTADYIADLINANKFHIEIVAFFILPMTFFIYIINVYVG